MRKRKGASQKQVSHVARSSGEKPGFFSSFFPGFHFSFTHKAPRVFETRISYDATYFHPRGDLSVYRRIWDDNRKNIATITGEKEDIENMSVEDKIEKCYALCQQPKDEIKRCTACWDKDDALTLGVNDPWKTFYDHATFREIVTPSSEAIFEKPMYDLRAHDRDRKREYLPSYPCAPAAPFSDKKCHYRTCPDEVKESPISRCPHLSEYYKKWLQATRDNQDYFIHRLRKESGFDEAITAFMRVLWTARWHRDKEERGKARWLLIDYLIPDQKEHKTGLLPHYKILVPMRELLLKLADHLSRKCKSDYLQSEDLNDLAIFQELLTWAQENDLRIFNIASKSKAALMQLIRKPAEYANSFMAKHYQISIRTLKMSLKQSVASLTRLY